MNDYIQSLRAAAQDTRAKREAQPMRQRGVGELVLDVATADANGSIFRGTQRLWGLVFAKGGSTPGVVLELRTAAGTLTLRPGDRLDQPLDEFEVRRSAQSATIGTAVLKLLQAEGVAFEESAGPSNDGGRVTYTAAQSSLLNVPSNGTPRTQGVTLRGGKGVRAIISAPSGQTVTAATVVWWLYDEGLQRWSEGPTQSSPPTGRRDVTTSDEFVLVGQGQAYAEVRSSTHSGAGDFTVTLVAN